MLLSGNCILMMKGEHIPSGSNTAETEVTTILWVIFARASGSFPRKSMRLSVFKFQFSSCIDDGWMIVVRPRFFHQQLWCVCLCDLWLVVFVTRYPLRQFESNFAEDVWNLLVDFECSLRCSDWLEKVFNVEVSLDRFNEIFVVFCVIFLHFMRSLTCTSRKTLCPKNVSWILVDFYLLPWIFSPENSLASAVIAWNSSLKKHRFYVGWNCYLVFSEAKNKSDQTLKKVWPK